MPRKFVRSLHQLFNRRLNVRFALILLLVTGALTAAGYFLHEFQVGRNASAFLQEARQAEDNGELKKAVLGYQRYLGFKPKDADASVRYALLLERGDKDLKNRRDAYDALQKAHRLAPDNSEVRRKLAVVGLYFGRFSEARDLLDSLLKDAPDDAELEYLRGSCGEGLGAYHEAIEYYGRAKGHDPHRLPAYLGMARVYRGRLKKDKEADEIVQQMVAENPDSTEAHLQRASYAKTYNVAILDQVRADLNAKLDKLAPQSADVVLMAAELEVDRKNLDKARAHLEDGLKHHARDPRLYQALARIELRANRRDEAIRHLRRGLDSLTGHTDNVPDSISLFLEAGDAAGAEALLSKLGKDEWSAALHGFFEARVRMREGKLLEARTLLERGRLQLDRVPSMKKQINHLALLTNLSLAQCYRRLGNPDARLAAARRATEIDSSSAEARRELAEANLALGLVEEAKKGFEGQTIDNPAARLDVARVQTVRNLRLPAAERRWEEVERTLDGAPPEVRKQSEWVILRAQVAAWQDRLDEAARLLDAALKESPKEGQLFLARASLELARRNFDKVAPLLDEAATVLSDRSEADLARVRVLLVMDKKDEAKKLLTHLEGEGNARPEAEQTRFLAGLAGFYLELGDARAAERLYRQLADKHPGEPTYHLVLFTLALQAGDDSALQRIVGELRKIEGDDGPLWRYGEGARLALLSRPDDVDALARARQLLAEAAKSRPSWGAVYFVEGQLEDKAGNTDAAIEKFLRAFDRGERNPSMAARLVQLLTEAHRHGEAQAVLRGLGDRVAQSGDLRRLAVATSLALPTEGGPDLERARKTIPADSKDFRDQLMLGQILLAQNKPAEAEKAFRQAVSLAPEQAAPRGYLVAFLVQANRKKEAQAEVAEIERRLPPTVAPLAAAAGYETLDQRDQAEKSYLAALAAQPQDVRVLRAVASFYLRSGGFAKSEPILRRLVATGSKAPPAALVWGRRNLAVALALNGDYSQSKEALALVEQNLKANPNSPEDQRAKAAVLARQPGSRGESIKVLKAAFGRVPATPPEQFLLAQLYEAGHKWPEAREAFTELFGTKGGDNPAYLAYFIVALLRNGDVNLVPDWLARLEKLEPDKPRTVGMKARVLKAQGKGDEATELLKKLAETHATDADAQLSIALLLDDLNLSPADAEARYRAYVQARAAEKPEAVLYLARHLAQHDRLAEALDLCEPAWKRSRPETVAVYCAEILRSAQPREADFERVEGWLKNALAQNQTSSTLARAYAETLDLHGHYAEAEELYRSLLKKDPKDVIAFNNLALLLALREIKGEESLSLIDKALELTGPAPSLLDTRGSVYLALRDGTRAAKDLEDAVAVQPSPASYFRLARARLLCREPSAAREALRKADNSGLKITQLHPLERNDYPRLRKEMEKEQ
jgi:cellulose synthase operon protein C